MPWHVWIICEEIREEIGKFLDGYDDSAGVQLGVQSVNFDHKRIAIELADYGVRVETTVSCIFTPHYLDHRKVSKIVVILDLNLYGWSNTLNKERVGIRASARKVSALFCLFFKC